MPQGSIAFDTAAVDTVNDAEEATVHAFGLSPSDLSSGTNVIAVEIHQRAPDSSDISFALRLEGTGTPPAATLDGDSDGMHDEWEVLHFGSTEAGDPDADSDGDGSSDSDEFLAGTSPLDPGSFFKIERITRTLETGAVEISWTATPGRIYTVLWSPDLVTPFSPIATGIVGGAYTDTINTTETRGFYMVQVGID